MAHLMIDDIIEFVSAKELNDENIKLAAEINSHIRICRECFDKVHSMQLIYDEFERMGFKSEFKDYCYSKMNCIDSNDQDNDGGYMDI